MIAVIFEVEPKEGRRPDYLAVAQSMRHDLEDIDGFISIERFESITKPGKILSLSFWRDEEAIATWRNLHAHRTAQQKGRNELFDGYRLRIAGVIRDYGMHDRAQAPEDSMLAHGG